MHVENLSIVPYDGTVTVTFFDAVIASSTYAKVLTVDGREGVYFIPFEDVYLEFLSEVEDGPSHHAWGDVKLWRVSAAGEAADHFMWAYETTEPALDALSGHGAFNPKAARIEAVPAARGAHSTALPA